MHQSDLCYSEKLSRLCWIRPSSTYAEPRCKKCGVVPYKRGEGSHKPCSFFSVKPPRTSQNGFLTESVVQNLKDRFLWRFHALSMWKIIICLKKTSSPTEIFDFLMELDHLDIFSMRFIPTFCVLFDHNMPLSRQVVFKVIGTRKDREIFVRLHTMRQG